MVLLVVGGVRSRVTSLVQLRSVHGGQAEDRCGGSADCRSPTDCTNPMVLFGVHSLDANFDLGRFAAVRIAR
jgi:hypothetical protein